MCKTIMVLESSNENKSYYRSFGSQLTKHNCSFKGNPISKLGLHLFNEKLMIFPLLDSWSSVFIPFD